MHTVNFLRHLVESHEALAYTLIFFGLIFEGEFILICTGILIHLEAVNVPAVLLAVLAGCAVKTFYCYYLGMVIARRWSKTRFFRFIDRRVHYLMPNFRKNPFWSIFLSKFIMWLNFSVIVYAGYRRTKWSTYLKAEALSTAIWAPALLAIGYFFSFAAIHMSREAGRFLLIVLGFTVAFLVLDRLVGMVYEIFEESGEVPGE